MFDVDGQNLVEDFTCLDCHNYYRGQPPFIESEYLTKQQIDFIKANYANQSCADDVKALLSELEEVTGLEIVTDLVSYEDGTADLLIFGENDKKEYFSLFCKAYNYLSPSIRAFGEDVETALEIIDSVLEWVESTKQEQMNSQVLKANFLLDLLANTGFQLSDNKTIEYNHYELMSLEAEAERVEAQEKSDIYSQMYRSISNQQILDILHKSLDDEGTQKLLFALIS
jgi:hypothetical protein